VLFAETVRAWLPSIAVQPTVEHSMIQFGVHML